MSETEGTKEEIENAMGTLKTEEESNDPVPASVAHPAEESPKSSSSQGEYPNGAQRSSPGMKEDPAAAIPSPERIVTSQPASSGDADADGESKDGSAMSVESGELEDDEEQSGHYGEVGRASNDDGEAQTIEKRRSDDEAETKLEVHDEEDTAIETPAVESQSEDADGSKGELLYGTRGRTTTGPEPTVTAVVGGESWERSTREALDEIARVKDPAPTTLGTSFLEALSEEERRTRTRFLPDVEGMHTLRKHEVKGDLALARSIVCGVGVSSLAPSKKSKGGKRARNEDEGMDLEEEEDTPPSEDDRGSDNARTGTSTIMVGAKTLIVPSNAFIPPTPTTASSHGEDGILSSSSKNRSEVLSPLVVEAVTAFDPPRPAESVGAKKKHRMLRWERRPEDLEVDLSNYRKTVQRTRQELHKAEAECERLETIDSHLRRHFLGHLNALNEEYYRLNEELGRTQQECVKAADLLTSRTRSRGAGKGSYVMRDVLTVLKSRGAEMKEKGIEPELALLSEEGKPAGLGGLSGAAFADWSQLTHFSCKKLANAWVLPGDKVQTPYGNGTVTDVFSLSILSESTEPFETTISLPSKGSKGNDTQKSPSSKRKDDPHATSSPKKIPLTDAAKTVTLNSPTLAPRVKVQLPYGTGYFSLGAVKSLEEPCVYSDAQLAKRWHHLFATASAVGPCLDIEGMSTVLEPAVAVATATANIDDSEDAENGDASAMEIEDEHSPRPEPTQSDSVAGAAVGEQNFKKRFLPFGASLLPSSAGRGNLIYDLADIDVEKEIHPALFEGGGVLGKVGVVSVAKRYCPR
jgi:hypothetical protein